MAVALHPERVADTRTMLWHIPDDGPATGRVASAPGRLGALLADGTIGGMVAARGLLWVRLGADASWAEHGTVVRDALSEALEPPRSAVASADACNGTVHGIGDDVESPGWGAAPADACPGREDVPEGTASRWTVAPADAEVLQLVTEYVLDTELGALLASHGGRIAIGSVTDDTVDFEFQGACSGCPASEVTLHDRLEAGIRARFPHLAAARVVGGSPRRGSLWPVFRARSHRAAS
jgi:Fe-S cluster biogenesis protein NfuA